MTRIRMLNMAILLCLFLLQLSCVSSINKRSFRGNLQDATSVTTDCERVDGAVSGVEVVLLHVRDGQTTELGRSTTDESGSFLIQPRLTPQQDRQIKQEFSLQNCRLQMTKTPYTSTLTENNLNSCLSQNGSPPPVDARIGFSLNGAVSCVITASETFRSRGRSSTVELLSVSRGQREDRDERSVGKRELRWGNEVSQNVTFTDVSFGKYKLLFKIEDLGPAETGEFYVCPGKTWNNDGQTYFWDIDTSNEQVEFVYTIKIGRPGPGDGEIRQESTPAE
jgi:hypothetical protein